jgi:hypothetical protein
MRDNDMSMSDRRKEELRGAIQERGALTACPRCRNNSFTLVEGYFTHPLQDNFKSISLGGPSIPTVVVVCDRCGFLSQHALGVLGLIPQKEGENDKGDEK